MKQPPAPMKQPPVRSATDAPSVEDVLFPKAMAELVANHRDTIDKLNEALEALSEERQLRERLAELLRRTAIALKGPEPEDVYHDWSDLPARVGAMKELVARMNDMLFRVEWVRQEGGSKHCCPFCHAISERDGGPDHADDCEWRLVTNLSTEQPAIPVQTGAKMECKPEL